MDSAWLGSIGKGLVKLIDCLDEFDSVELGNERSFSL